MRLQFVQGPDAVDVEAVDARRTDFICSLPIDAANRLETAHQLCLKAASRQGGERAAVNFGVAIANGVRLASGLTTVPAPTSVDEEL